MITVRVELEGLDGIERALAAAPFKTGYELNLAVQKSIRDIAAGAVREAPVNKQSGGGNLRQSIRQRMTSGISGVVEALAPYAAYVHEGTAPSPGRFVPGLGTDGKGRRLVNGKNVGTHPGQKANPFLQRAVDKTMPKIKGYFEAAIKAVTDTLKA